MYVPRIQKNIVITMTGSPMAYLNYDYSNVDRVLKDKFRPERPLEIFYSGQVKGVDDVKLINAIDENISFSIYHREKRDIPFNYVGMTTNVKISKTRSVPKGQEAADDERMQLHILVDNPVMTRVNPTPERGHKQFKLHVFDHAGLSESCNNRFKGIYLKKNNIIEI
ncbi:hypothetical protein [Heterosigma akashiwo virus 01]|uniref:Uncharacterized protein n=1 Tax=Heterosigma akashiwo virus 01 TaxID=97195 RepID=A0A1C9C5D2_HAV01|nr:hypothetical protein D1R72_gp162 [Heterosigma akashiwo virus 01]AOM63493.1 hypothetical protein [Heterosigma akashiwo virus 01]